VGKILSAGDLNDFPSIIRLVKKHIKKYSLADEKFD
jgi:hypothetical protein